MSVSLAGMRTTQVNGIVLHGTDAVTADAQLKVASASETVDVTAEAPLVNMDNQTISDTIRIRRSLSCLEIAETLTHFSISIPNITQADADGTFKFLGAQSYGANFSLDGQKANGGVFGAPTESKPSLEAVGEINVLSNDFSAEYCRRRERPGHHQTRRIGLPRFGFLQ